MTYLYLEYLLINTPLPKKIKIVIGLMKFEIGQKIMKEFVELRAKT